MIAVCLGSVQKLETFKLLNVIGILYGIIGVLVLSEFVVENARWREFVIAKVSGVLLWVHLAVPLGAAVISVVLSLLARERYPSAMSVANASFAFFVWTIPGGLIVENVVFVPKWAHFRDPVLRTRFFGLLLVVGGLLVQLIAGIEDLLR
jgi:hypothetical protein